MDQPKLEKIVDFKVPTAALALSSVDDSDQHYAIGCMDGVYLLNMGEQSFEKLDHHDSYVSSIAASGRGN